MHVTCANCGARYTVDPAAIGPTGRTVQCVRCSHRWRERSIDLAPSSPRRPATDFVLPPPSPYRSDLSEFGSPPARQRWGRWLAAAMVVVVGLGAGAYAWREEIADRLPSDWRGIVKLDAARGFLRQ